MTTSLALVLTLAGCAATEAANRPDGGSRDTGGNEPSADTDSNDVADTGEGGELPPEEEADPYRLRPAETEDYIFVVNPERDSVTRIEVATQKVDTAAVGRRPVSVAVTPDGEHAVVFNFLDDSVSLLDAKAAVLVDTVVGVRDNLNTLSLSPDGSWAVVWHDIAAERTNDPPRGSASSYKEVSLVEVATGRHVALVAGFEPKSVQFTPDGALALLSSDAFLATLDLRASTPVPTFVPLADPLDAPVAEEVVLAPDGTFAFVRQRDADMIAVVDLATKVVTSVAVPAGPTDLDLTADGTGAIVVSRTAHKVSVLDVDAPTAEARVVAFPEDEPFGSIFVGPDGLAILYTSTGATSRIATWQVDTDVVRLRLLPKPVAALSITSTGDTALVIHDATDAADGSTPEPYRNRAAVSLVSLLDFRSNTVSLSKPAKGYANADDGRRGYLVLEGVPTLLVLDYGTLIYDEVPLRSTPVFVGALPDLTPSDDVAASGWVTQEHPLGRISFYDPNDGSLETITGFELNGSIEE